MLSATLAAFSAFLLSLFLTPLARFLAMKLNVLDLPNHRTVHLQETPRLGGISIFVSFCAGVAIFSLGHSFDSYLAILAGGCVVATVGFFDDLFVLNCYKKLLAQTAAAGIAVYFGFRIEMITLFSGTPIELGIFSIPLSLFWIVGVINAINLQDGLDGLAGGISTLLAACFLTIGLVTGSFLVTSFSLILIAPTLGFLKHNFRPARIFMGDTGSLFLGFALACLAIEAFTRPGMGTNIVAMFVPFCVPLTDTLLAILRRLSNGQHPFHADKKHIHHMLLESGLTQTMAVFIEYVTTLVFGALGIAVFFWGNFLGYLLLLLTLAVFLTCLFHFGCFDFVVKRRLNNEPEFGVNQEANT
jgi:UDP-GlcNAc:undecaprenyl-phosphate GlcNAc-1-phosphate transferase